MNAMLLAAGLGTRLRPFTMTTPKPAIPFMTVPLACYSLSLWQDLKIDNLVVNTHHLSTEIQNLFEKINWPCRKLIFSAEPEKILGSGGGIRHALADLLGNGDFLVANADEVILPNVLGLMKEALHFHRWHKGIATIVAMPHEKVGTQFGGLWLKNAGTQVSCFSKMVVPGHEGLHFIGMMILSDRLAPYFFTDDTAEENILYDTLTKAMQAGEEVHAFRADTQWFETGNPEDFLAATEVCCRELQKPQPSAWAEQLAQIIRLNSTGAMLIEQTRPDLQKVISENLPKWLAGI